jgi:hypothetical protein
MDEDLNKKLDILIKNTSTPKLGRRIWISFMAGVAYSLGIVFTTSFLIYIIVYLLSKSPIYPLIQPYLKIK